MESTCSVVGSLFSDQIFQTLSHQQIPCQVPLLPHIKLTAKFLFNLTFKVEGQFKVLSICQAKEEHCQQDSAGNTSLWRGSCAHLKACPGDACHRVPTQGHGDQFVQRQHG